MKLSKEECRSLDRYHVVTADGTHDATKSFRVL